MKTSLSRSIVNCFYNIVFSKKALLSLALISMLTANSSLYGMDAAEATPLAEAALATATIVAPEVVVPVGIGMGVGVGIGMAAPIIAQNLPTETMQRGYAEAKALEDGADGSEEADDQTTQSSQVVQNPHPNISSNGGSISLAIPTDTTAVKEVNPLLDRAEDTLVTDEKQIVPAKEQSQDKTKDADKSKADALQKSADVDKKSTTTQEQQTVEQAPDTAAEKATVDTQSKARETQISGSTLQLNPTGDKVVDPVVTFLQKQKEDAKAADLQASTEIQDFVYSGVAESIAKSTAHKDARDHRLNVDKTLITMSKKHPERAIACIYDVIWKQLGISRSQISNLQLNEDGTLEFDTTPEYKEQAALDDAKRKLLSCGKERKEFFIFNRAFARVKNDLGKIKEIVSTSGDLQVPKELALNADYTFVGVTADGKDVYRSDVIRIRQRISRGIWHRCADRDYVVDVIIDDTGNAKTRSYFSDQVNDSKLIKPENPAAAPSTRDIPKTHIDASSDASTTKTTTSTPADTSATTSVDAAAGDTSYSRAKEKADPIIITVAAPAAPEPDPEDEDDKKLMEHIESIVKRQQKHIFSDDHKDKGLNIVRKTEAETASAISKKVYQLSKRGLVRKDGMSNFELWAKNIKGETVEFTIRVSSQNGNIQNINAFIGHSDRPVDYLVRLEELLAVAALPVAQTTPVNIQSLQPAISQDEKSKVASTEKQSGQQTTSGVKRTVENPEVGADVAPQPAAKVLKADEAKKEEPAQKTHDEQAAQEKKTAEDAQRKETASQTMERRNRRLSDYAAHHNTSATPQPGIQIQQDSHPLPETQQRHDVQALSQLRTTQQDVRLRNLQHIQEQGTHTEQQSAESSEPQSKRQKPSQPVESPESTRTQLSDHIQQATPDTVPGAEIQPATLNFSIEDRNRGFKERVARIQQSSTAQSSPAATTVITQKTDAVEEKGATSQATTTPENPPAKQVAEQKQAVEQNQAAEQQTQTSTDKKRALETPEVGADVAPQPAAKVAKADERQSSVPLDARKELEKQMADTYKSDPAGFPRILQQVKKDAAPVIQRYEEQQATSFKRTFTDISPSSQVQSSVGHEFHEKATVDHSSQVRTDARQRIYDGKTRFVRQAFGALGSDLGKYDDPIREIRRRETAAAAQKHTAATKQSSFKQSKAAKSARSDVRDYAAELRSMPDGDPSDAAIIKLAIAGYHVAKGAYYLCKLGVTFTKDLGQTCSYFFGDHAKSDIKAQYLEYLFLEDACIQGSLSAMSNYESTSSSRLLTFTGAVFECKIRELNEKEKQSEKQVYDSLSLLQLPPKNIEEIQKNAAEKQPDLTGSEDPDDVQVIQKAVITSAHEVCARYLRRIAFAQAAKKDFDARKFKEAKANLQESFLLYNEEQIHWIRWRDNHAILNPEEKMTKEYVHFTEKGKPSAIKAFTGTHTQHIFHDAIVKEFNTCRLLINENSYNVFGNCTVFTLESMINSLLDIAEQFNIKNEFRRALYLITACRELNLLAKGLSEINEIKDMRFFERCSFGIGSFFSLESGIYMDCEVRFGQRFKNKIVIKGEPWTTTPPRFEQITGNLSHALLSSCKDKKDLNEQFLPQVTKLLKDLETKQPDSPENAIVFVANRLLFGNSLVQQIDEPAKKILEDLRIAIRRERLINKNIEEIQATAPIKTILIKTLQKAISKVQTGEYKQEFEETPHQPEQPAPQTAPQPGQTQGHAPDVEMQDAPQDPSTAAESAGQVQGAASAAAGQTTGKTGATYETDVEMLAASQASMDELPRPLQIYMQQAQHIDHSNPSAVRALVIQCDEINKTTVFDAPIPNKRSIIQLPSLYQLYEGLELFPEYGNQYGVLCGYYAAHFAKIFAANPHATHQELIERLNDRNAFEAQTLIPGKEIILVKRVPIQQVVDLQEGTEGNFSDLLGNEIEQLLTHDVLDRTIIVGSVAEGDALHNERSSIRAGLLAQRFKDGQIDYLIYILPTENRNHWVCAIARREGNQHVHLIIADSIGMDRRSMEEITNVYQNLVSPEQQAAEQLAARIQSALRAPQEIEQHPGD